MTMQNSLKSKLDFPSGGREARGGVKIINSEILRKRTSCDSTLFLWCEMELPENHRGGVGILLNKEIKGIKGFWIWSLAFLKVLDYINSNFFLFCFFVYVVKWKHCQTKFRFREFVCRCLEIRVKGDSSY